MIREQELGAAMSTHCHTTINQKRERAYKTPMFVYDHDADLDVTKSFKLNHKKKTNNKLNQQTKEKIKNRLITFRLHYLKFIRITLAYLARCFALLTRTPL